MCDCPEARAWARYWSPEGIAERLDQEVKLYRQIVQDAVWWGGSTSPVPPRAAPLNTVPLPGDYGEMEIKRAVPGEYPPRKKR